MSEVTDDEAFNFAHKRHSQACIVTEVIFSYLFRLEVASCPRSVCLVFGRIRLMRLDTRLSRLVHKFIAMAPIRVKVYIGFHCSMATETLI